MAFTTHPNQLDTRRGLRAGLIGLAFVAEAVALAVAAVLLGAVGALGLSVVTDDRETAPAAVDFPTVDDMRAENQIIRDAVRAQR